MDFSLEDKNRDEQDSMTSSIASILDVGRMELDNDETWLYKVSHDCSKSESNIEDWLQDEFNVSESDAQFESKPSKLETKSQKMIDTRTFTRPKKRYTRPTINEIYKSGDVEQNEMSSSGEMLKKSSDSGVFSTELTCEGSDAWTPQHPLHFDLAQPSSSFYFENVVGRGEPDSFQNMSPPSLVTSLCSSTFANLMESSFIRNDPVLRQIRDTDYSALADAHDSLGSDSPEAFLSRVADDTFSLIRAQEVELNCGDDTSLSETILKNFGEDHTANASHNAFLKSSKVNSQEKSKESVVLNGTYRRSLNRTKELNTTFDIDSFDESDPNESNIKPAESIEEILDAKVSETFGANFSGTYRKTPKLHGTFRKSDISKSLNSTYGISNGDNHSDVSHKTESSLDKSSEHKEASQVLDGFVGGTNAKTDATFTQVANGMAQLRLADSPPDMAQVDAIVRMQERSLNQVMSTPISGGGTKKLFDNHLISPIVGRGSSDSDLSSNGENVVGSHKMVPQVATKQPKSLGYMGTKSRGLSVAGSLSDVRGGAQRASNLRTVAPRLRGSYTSLRPPVSANLPVAPPAPAHAQARVVEVAPTRRPTAVGSANEGAGAFAKPAPPTRTSAIPRPASRIPAPRSSLLRPVSSRNWKQNVG